MDSRPCLVLTTCPDENIAHNLALHLLDNQLAACIQIQPGIRSLYMWKGALEEACEVQLVIKTIHGRLGTIETALQQLHPYEVPEYLVIDAQAGSADYLQWLHGVLEAC
jgi:periplasmic divalent cation tolerance protein